MNLTAHIVRKDLFRLRWVLVLWVVALTTRMALASVQAELDVTGYYPFYAMAWVFGLLFLPVLGFGLVMGAQSDDPTSDTDAFWITRPISGGRLLGARCVLLVLLGTIPPLATAPWWIAHGFGASQLAAAFLQLARWQLVLTAVALPFAALSSTSTRFVMGVMLAAVGAFSLVLAVRFFSSGPSVPPVPGVLESRAWVVLALWLAAGLAVVLIQFLTRRTALSVALLLAVLVAACVAGCCWRWNFFSEVKTARLPADPAPELHLTAGPQVRGLAVHEEYKATRSEKNEFAIVTGITQQLTWPDESISLVSAPLVADQLSRACAALALDTPERSGVPADFVLPDDPHRQRLLREAPRSAATLTGTVMHAEVIASLRPRTGEVSGRDGFRIKLLELIPNDLRGVAMTVAESMPDPSSDLWRALFAPSAAQSPKTFYFLVNRTEGRALAATVAAAGTPLAAGAMMFRRRELVFPLHQEQFAGWAPTALLIEVAVREAGPFSVVAEAPRFEAKAAGESGLAPTAAR